MSNQNALGAPILTNPSKTFYVNSIGGNDNPLVGRGSIGLPFSTLTEANTYISTNSLNLEGAPISIIIQAGEYPDATPLILPYTFIYGETPGNVIFTYPIGLDASWSTATGEVIAGIENINCPNSTTAINFSAATLASSINFYPFNNVFNNTTYSGQLAATVIVHAYNNFEGNVIVDGLSYYGNGNTKSSFAVNTTFNTTYLGSKENILGTGNSLIVDGGASLTVVLKNSPLPDLTTIQTSGTLSLDIDASSYPHTGISNTGAAIVLDTSADGIIANVDYTPVNYAPGNGGGNFAAESITGNLYGIDGALALTQQFQTYNYVIDSGIGAGDYVANITPAINGLSDGLLVRFKVGTTNTGASTLTVNGFGPISITTTTIATLTGGELFNGMMAELQYDGTQWQLLNPANVNFYDEQIVPLASAVGLVSNTASVIAFVTVDPGTWDISGNITLDGGGATLLQYFACFYDTTGIPALPDASLYTGNSLGTTGVAVFAAAKVGTDAPALRITVTVPTTVSVCVKAGFTVSTCVACGQISARRVAVP